ncbi:MAG: hypothetical protein EOP50_07680 [Sphingobacteriales bacterium]|nr:MAG: hypothetical protein EOP50_07680 [Sphingobacteriales bacterium]
MRKAFYALAVAACGLLAACSTTKHIAPGEHLYTGARITLANTDDLSARERKTLRSDLQGLIRPKANTRFLGIPLKLGIYNLFYNKKPNSFFGRLRDRLGEPPVLLSSVNIGNNVKLLDNHMQNKGFFQVHSSGDSTVKGKKGHVNFRVEANAQYSINSVRFPTDSIELTRDIAADADKTLLLPKDPYDLDVIKGERNRIDARLKEKGYFYFNPDYLLVQVDSTIGNHKVDMVLKVKEDAPQDALVPYRINNTYIYANYRLNGARIDTALSGAEVYQGYSIIDRRKRFKPWFWPRIMVFHSGDLYNRTDHNTTLARLINLNEFRYVKNRFEPVGDSAKLDAYYYLTPQQKKNLRAEFGLTTKSNNWHGNAVRRHLPGLQHVPHRRRGHLLDPPLRGAFLQCKYQQRLCAAFEHSARLRPAGAQQALYGQLIPRSARVRLEAQPESEHRDLSHQHQLCAAGQRYAGVPRQPGASPLPAPRDRLPVHSWFQLPV